jgi:hypothetical protein
MIPRDSSGLTALAGALRQHTGLQEFSFVDWFYRGTLETVQDVSLDPVLRALVVCPHLRRFFITTKCASDGAMKNLLKSGPTTFFLVLNTEHWLAVTDGIRQGRCNIKSLDLVKLQSSSSGNSVKPSKR